MKYVSKIIIITTLTLTKLVIEYRQQLKLVRLFQKKLESLRAMIQSFFKDLFTNLSQALMVSLFSDGVS